MSDTQKKNSVKPGKAARAARVDQKRSEQSTTETNVEPTTSAPAVVEATVVTPKTSETPASEVTASNSSKSIKPGKAARAARVAERKDAHTDKEGDKKPAGEEKSKADFKKERRAIQEAQRLKKAGAAAPAKTSELSSKQVTAPKETNVTLLETQMTKLNLKFNVKGQDSLASSIHNLAAGQSKQSKLFHHFEQFKRDYSVIERYGLDNPVIHPAFQKFGIECANDCVTGSNERCLGFLHALKKFFNDYKAPSSDNKSISKDLEHKLKPNINFLCQCRPLAISVANAIKEIKQVILYFPPDITESQAKDILNEEIERFIDEKILLAWETISKYTLADSDTVISGTSYVKSKITNDDCILIYGGSTLVTHLIVQASRKFPKLRVVVVDSRPKLQGKKVLEELVKQGIECTYGLINAISFIMPKVTKVMMGAHALLANGYVMGTIGSSQISLVAKSFNVPVVICCETYKFCEKVQTDALLNNELDDPLKMLSFPNSKHVSPLVDRKQEDEDNINLLNLTYDITSPNFISCVISDMGMLPCTSVPVVLRLKNRDFIQCGAKRPFKHGMQGIDQAVEAN